MSALYFDLDGTLIDSAHCAVISTQDTFRKYCRMELGDALIVERMGIPIEVMFRELSHGRIHDGNWDEVAAYYRARYAENSGHLVTVFPGIEEFLDKISQRIENLAIVTSKHSKAARHNLETLKIDRYFPHIIGSDIVDHYKPHPDPVYKARAFLTKTPAFEMVIGDADTDIVMGKAAGVLTCAVAWGAHPRARLAAAEPDYLADTVDDLRSVIEDQARRAA